MGLVRRGVWRRPTVDGVEAKSEECVGKWRMGGAGAGGVWVAGELDYGIFDGDQSEAGGEEIRGVPRTADADLLNHCAGKRFSRWEHRSIE